MRIRAARMIAGWMIVTVVASAVMTCIPGAMHMQASQMPSCASMDDDSPCIWSDVATDCCTHHDPTLTSAKADLLKGPLQLVLPWLPPAVIVPTSPSLTRAESRHHPISTVGPPTYIALSTLRV